MLEHWNSGVEFIFYGKDSELLQSSLVLVNTLIIQQILADPGWAKRLTARDKKALTALIWAHVNPPLRHLPHRHEHPPRPRSRQLGRPSGMTRHAG